MLMVSYMVEGQTDRPIAERLLQVVGARPATTVEAMGKSKLDAKLPGLNRAARAAYPWLVLRDLDHDDIDGCCGPLVTNLFCGAPSADMVFRLAVRSAEAWLLADRRGFAKFFKVGVGSIPIAVDEIEDPKARVVDLCRQSRSGPVRDGISPRRGSGRRAGPRYVELVSEFTAKAWDPGVARRCSPSLERALERLTERATSWAAPKR